jgi:3-hydroxyacyl-CoA dehydrogenase
LLCGGVPAETIRQAALQFGMPMSPLELVDLIGARTAFDGGRIVWAAFPSRMDPSPLLPAMVKAKRSGVAVGEGFYHYDDAGKRISDNLAANAEKLLQKYQHDEFAELPSSDPLLRNLVAELFAATMRLEAIAIERDGVADRSAITTAMRGGLGWRGATANAGPRDFLSEECANQLAAQFPKLKCIQSI